MLLPLWYDTEGNKQYHIPPELFHLTEAEKLMIHMVSVYAPVFYLSMGQLGCKGHVCCFEKDLSGICTILPHLPSDVSIVKVIQTYKDNNNDIHSKAFKVWKQHVLDALCWLCKYNILYKEAVTIEENNLDWISDSIEDNIPCSENIESVEPQHLFEQDLGPSLSQQDPINHEEFSERVTGGITQQFHAGQLSEENQAISRTLEAATASAKTIQWPYTNNVAISKYGDNQNLFCKAFPWLFPGGIGDFSQYSDITETPSQWAQ